MGKLFKKLFKNANAGRIILSLIDLSALLESKDIKTVLNKVKNSVKGNKVKITAENVEDFAYILGALADDGVKDLANLIRLSEEVESDED